MVVIFHSNDGCSRVAGSRMALSIEARELCFLSGSRIGIRTGDLASVRSNRVVRRVIVAFVLAITIVLRASDCISVWPFRQSIVAVVVGHFGDAILIVVLLPKDCITLASISEMSVGVVVGPFGYVVSAIMSNRHAGVIVASGDASAVDIEVSDFSLIAAQIVRLRYLVVACLAVYRFVVLVEKRVFNFLSQIIVSVGLFVRIR